jgi:cell division protein FtsI/penicillin-binding protein 2
MGASSRRRALWFGATVAFGFTLFSWRLIYLQVERHEHYAMVAAEKHSARQTIYARRGSIVDRNGVLLASNEPVKTVVVDGSLLHLGGKTGRKGGVKPAENRPDQCAEILARHLEMPYDVVRAKLDRKLKGAEGAPEEPSRYIVIKKEVSEWVAEALVRELAQKKIRGVLLEQESIRVYPNGGMGCHVVGFVNHDGVGQEGVERAMNDWLKGRDGYRFTERDRTGRELPAFRKLEAAPHDGHLVQLTLDMAVQDIVESELETLIKQYRPKMATCVVMRPGTGEVIAMANRPHYDLNQREGVSDEARKNRAIMDQIEPGSTFKVVTTAAALDQKLVKAETGINCENGKFTYGGSTLHDHGHGYGYLTVNDVIVKSSNIGVAKMGLMLGEARLYDYIRKFGFGERTGIQLPGEISGIVHPPHRWSKISITHIPMGHEVGATPIQVVNTMCTIANRGRLMIPQVVSSISSGSGEEVARFHPVEVREVIPADVCEKLIAALSEVVSKKGTAEKAFIPGFPVAGKTGTAQKIAPAGGYEHNKYVVSFAGFFPIQNPEFCILVLVDDAQAPSNLNYGGQIAAPVFSRIGQRVARLYNLSPQLEFMKMPPAVAQNAKGGH